MFNHFKNNKMKNSIMTIALWLLSTSFGMAQVVLKGTVRDAQSGTTLPGTNLYIENSGKGAISDAQGRFVINGLPQGTIQLRVSYVGYETSRQTVNLSAETELDIKLMKSELMGEEIIVFSTRASDKTPATFKNIVKKEIEKQNLGQDIPFLLNQTPSVVVNSDAGTGIGYTGIRIRGSDATRINVTINGIPLNDSESHGVFWVNMPDFASSVDNIQIQRGVGTSTNGAAAFGASINIQTDALNSDAYASVDNSFGSFNSWKHTVRAGTGLIDGKFSLDTRLSKISSDGFIDRASSDLQSFYISGGYHGAKSLLRLNVFSGHEITYQAWEGIPESRLRGDVEGMQAYISRNGLNAARAQNLLQSNSRTYNFYDYKNQVDNYRQSHYQAIYALQANEEWSFQAALHYTRGLGYFEQFRPNDRLSSYGLPNVVIGGQSISRTDIVRRRWLDNHFYGTTFSAIYQPSNKLEITTGGGWNRYDGDHYGEIIWAGVTGNVNYGDRYYDNNAVKTDLNLFSKWNYQFNNKLNLFADVQLRNIDYTFYGFNQNLERVDTNVKYTFFNPKSGFTFDLTNNALLYASYAVANREPIRRDFIDSSPTSRPRPENMQNIEVGIRKVSDRYQLNFNHYLMLYKDQLILTGRVNDVGAYTRTNVDRSYRLGFEADGAYILSPKFSLAANLTWSQNKIIDFVEYIDDYDVGGQTQNALGKTDIAFSPDWVGGASLIWKPASDFELTWLSKYVGEQFMDNASSPDRKLNAFFVQDLRFNYLLRTPSVQHVRLSLMLNNLWDIKYEPNGYTFGYIVGGERIVENFYYPMAGRNFMLGIAFDF
jgi:iron complex outermembrane recepter protein